MTGVACQHGAPLTRLARCPRPQHVCRVSARLHGTQHDDAEAEAGKLPGDLPNLLNSNIAASSQACK